MRSIQEREQNLFNATDTLAQFYEEVESFFDILSNKMEREGFTVNAERLRPGTFTLNNLHRRLIGSISVIYIKGATEGVDEEEELEDEEVVEDGVQNAKAAIGKAEVRITQDLCIPFAFLSLFTPRNIPSVRNLSSPMLYVGAIGKPTFLERKTGKDATPEDPVLSLSSLVNMRLKSDKKAGDKVLIPCWRPSRMRKYELEARLLAFEGQPLLAIDSQEKIAEIAKKLSSFCSTS